MKNYEERFDNLINSLIKDSAVYDTSGQKAAEFTFEHNVQTKNIQKNLTLWEIDQQRRELRRIADSLEQLVLLTRITGK